MSLKLVIPRLLANREVEDAIDHCLREQAPHAALGFVEALERAYAHLARHLGTGSPRYAQALELPGLRSWPLGKYPYIVFYMERDDHVDVWRVLHGKRDISASLHEGDVSGGVSGVVH